MTMWIDMKKHFEVRSLEWFGSFYLSGWGSYVILHPGMFTDPRKADHFKGLIAMGDQQDWGFCVFVAGMIRMTALFINGRWGLTPWIRAATAFMSVGVWFAVCVGMFRVGYNTGIVMYPLLLAADMFSTYRAASDASEQYVNNKVAKVLRERGLTDPSSVTPFVRRG